MDNEKIFFEANFDMEALRDVLKGRARERFAKFCSEGDLCNVRECIEKGFVDAEDLMQESLLICFIDCFRGDRRELFEVLWECVSDRVARRDHIALGFLAKCLYFSVDCKANWYANFFLSKEAPFSESSQEMTFFKKK